MACHPERSEGSMHFFLRQNAGMLRLCLGEMKRILRCAQDDSLRLACVTHLRHAALVDVEGFSLCAKERLDIEWRTLDSRSLPKFA